MIGSIVVLALCAIRFQCKIMSDRSTGSVSEMQDDQYDTYFLPGAPPIPPVKRSEPVSQRRSDTKHPSMRNQGGEEAETFSFKRNPGVEEADTFSVKRNLLAQKEAETFSLVRNPGGGEGKTFHHHAGMGRQQRHQFSDDSDGSSDVSDSSGSDSSGSYYDK